MEPNAQLNVMILGGKGAGKSSTMNTILGQQAFISKKGSCSLTEDVAVESATVNGQWITVYDTPGYDTGLKEEVIVQKLKKVLQECESGLSVFLLVIKADRFTEEERKTVVKIEKLLGEERLKNTWILFTRGDELEEENTTIQEYINQYEGLKKLIQKYDQRYHVFNNKKRGSRELVSLLLVKIIQRSLAVKDGGKLTRQIPDRANTPDVPVSSPSSMRIVLLGKTGVGKSAAGNTILGQKVFRSEISSKSVTYDCLMKHATVSGRSVSVVDTPGFFDTEMNPEDLAEEIARSVYLSSPGPHAFLIFFKVNDRFTEQEQQIPQMIEIMFGQEVLKYSIILFTHGDQLKGKTIEEIIEENSRLRHVVQQCGGRYQVFNNEDEKNRQQVNDLLQKIDTMIEQNGGGHYSNQMYEDAQRFRREEERRLREEEERMRKETEERFRVEIEDQRFKLQRPEETIKKMKQENKQELEDTDKDLKEKSRKEQSNPEFKEFYKQHKRRLRFYCLAFQKCVPALAAVCFGAIGGAVGIIGGPPGICAGAAFGTAVGTAVGAIMMEQKSTEKKKK